MEGHLISEIVQMLIDVEIAKCGIGSVYSICTPKKE